MTRTIKRLKIGSLLALFLLAGTGYTAGAEVQTDQLTNRIQALEQIIDRLEKEYEASIGTRKVRHLFKQRIKRKKKKLEVLKKETSSAGVSAQGLIPQANPAFKLGDVYCFPNPAKRQTPTFHIELGIADKVDLSIYDLSGDLVHKTSLSGTPQVIDDGQGPQYAYEYTWNISDIGSGVYIYAIRARKGKQNIRSVGKCAVIK